MPIQTLQEQQSTVEKPPIDVKQQLLDYLETKSDLDLSYSKGSQRAGFKESRGFDGSDGFDPRTVSEHPVAVSYRYQDLRAEVESGNYGKKLSGDHVEFSGVSELIHTDIEELQAIVRQDRTKLAVPLADDNVYNDLQRRIDAQAQNFANAGTNEQLKKEIDTEMDRLIAQRDTRTERGRIILNGLRFRAKQDQLESLLEVVPQQ
jgi:hypothetical protein